VSCSLGNFSRFVFRLTVSHIVVRPNNPLPLFGSQNIFRSYTLLQYFIESHPQLPLTAYQYSAMLELDIIIVGAGIAGLASAITLSRAGHNVQVSAVGPQKSPNHYRIIIENVSQVLEKSSFKREAGFMITLTAPATRVLESFGIAA
jgi:hypothetical protein